MSFHLLYILIFIKRADRISPDDIIKNTDCTQAELAYLFDEKLITTYVGNKDLVIPSDKGERLLSHVNIHLSIINLDRV